MATPRPDRPYVPGPLGRAISGAYASVVGRRNAGFDAGRGVVTFDRPVISVGNLTLGGTGKTPMVASIVALLRSEGHDPCVAMRGYRAGRTLNGRSDEADLFRGRFEDLPVVAQPKRVEGLIRLFHSDRGERVDSIVLDDGFQHRRVARQVDIVMIDATRDLLAGRVFPAGRLREPVANTRRATHIVITHADLVEEHALAALERGLGELAPDVPRALAAHEWAGLMLRVRGGIRTEPVHWLAGRRVIAACAIGSPASFLAAVGRAGARSLESFVLRDHDPFAPGTVERISAAAREAGAEAIVLTEKDWTKLADRAVEWPCPIVVPRLELALGRGWPEMAADILRVAASAPE